MPDAGETRARVGIVVVGFNNRALLADCFQSAYAQIGVDVRVIYVDNGSADGSAAYVRDGFPNATVIEARTNLGFAAANNLGFAAALSDPGTTHVVALNSDARLTPDWARQLVAFTRAHPDAACLQGETVRFDRPEEIDSFGLYISRAGICTQIGSGRTDLDARDMEVFAVNAAAALYTRTFLERQPFGAEIFDADLFMYAEDVDLSARALALGMRNYAVAGARALHIGSASVGQISPMKIRLVHRNILPVMVKNLPLRLIAATLCLAVPIETLRLGSYLVRGRTDLARAMLAGRLAGLPLALRLIRKRRVLLAGARSRPISDYHALMHPAVEHRWAGWA